MATAEFSKFADILSTAPSQHHLLGFEIAQLEFHHLILSLFIVLLPKAHLTSHFRMSGSSESHHHDYLGPEDLFLHSSLPRSSPSWIQGFPQEDGVGN